MKKECKVYGYKNNKEFKFKFIFDKEDEDYLERFCEELNVNDVMMEDVQRLYIKEIKSK